MVYLEGMVAIVSRAQWGARPPTSVVRTTWSKRIGVAVHYSAGSPTSTPRDLQDYAMNQLGYMDGHYNFLVDRNGVAYEGRGWLVVAAHSAGNNTAWIGICFIGRDNDVTDAAKNTIRALYDEANRLSGKTLQFSGHGQLPGANTDCPGNNLRAWVAAGMPYLTGDDMTFGYNDEFRLAAMFELRDEVELDQGGGVRAVVPVPISLAIKTLTADVEELKERPPVQSAPVDAAALKAVLLDPEVLAAIAKAVTDEIGS